MYSGWSPAPVYAHGLIGRGANARVTGAATVPGQEDRLALRLEHGGPATTATVTLGSVGTALPGSVTTAPLRVGRGERIELRQWAWTGLGRGRG